MITIWHNPRCSKSRQTLAMLQERGCDITIRNYLEDAPSEVELRQVLITLGARAADIIRSGEAIFKELGLSKSDDETALVAAMAANPILIERPIVCSGNRAAIGRPPESVLSIL